MNWTNHQLRDSWLVLRRNLPSNWPWLIDSAVQRAEGKNLCMTPGNARNASNVVLFEPIQICTWFVIYFDLSLAAYTYIAVVYYANGTSTQSAKRMKLLTYYCIMCETVNLLRDKESSCCQTNHWLPSFQPLTQRQLNSCLFPQVCLGKNVRRGGTLQDFRTPSRPMARELCLPSATQGQTTHVP